MSHIIAKYQLHNNPSKIDTIAEKLAVGLTVGSWTDLTAEDQAHLEQYKGEVITKEIIDAEKGLLHIAIAYPEHNITPDFSSILTTVFGKLSLDGKVKLLDIDFTTYSKHFKGPTFGVEGVRDLLNIYDRPLVMSIFKGIIGRDAAFFEAQLRAQALSVDIIKDDEILYDVPELPFEERITIGKRVLDEIFEATGRRVLYAVNLSGPVFELPDKARKAKQLGANALLFNVHTYGLDALRGLRDLELDLPILAHPALSGALCGSPDYGISYQLLLSKLTRLAGADLILFPVPYGSIELTEDDAKSIVAHALEGSTIKKAFPVPSAGIHPGLVKRIIDDFGEDIVINAGGGVHGHPDGATAGGEAFHEAIRHYKTGVGGKHYDKAVALWGTS
ncbi:2,3-diketo-5-methylthiopentyl-1-phosphate enolase [Macrococcoides bohemicum]|uniref:2,3-diketo-5-methylthiopentyl-1-phosphate enolase n=1 Tax=Macrococcoides bohemicum TaxID=1903056 RepID=A0AAJ4PAS9_9STAP|nr:2,3-diketo-5-methylthiopentyl-1-phosphate enolase [Macrococcus bohemicus]QYA42240.1 2,3-diketo-5-methylthiopentyl-1-phosphate enolase [Macrococcus bohemicus]TDL36552.1 2,3-diketo-5-methylthiopentyl-1-phosphate enolase [Macrococcus bohemicus]